MLHERSIATLILKSGIGESSAAALIRINQKLTLFGKLLHVPVWEID